MSWHNELAGFAEKSPDEQIAELQALNAKLREALTDVRKCQSESHTFCAECLMRMDAALSLSGPASLAGLKAQVLRELRRKYTPNSFVRLDALDEEIAALEAEGEGDGDEAQQQNRAHD